VEQTQAWNLSSGKPWKLAFSWGVSEFDHNGNGDIKAWLEDADAKMYAMKTKTIANASDIIKTYDTGYCVNNM
jgi:hypothetical protein